MEELDGAVMKGMKLADCRAGPGAYDKKSMNIWVKIAREQARETKTETETRKMLGKGSEREKGKRESRREGCGRTGRRLIEPLYCCCIAGKVTMDCSEWREARDADGG